MATIKILVDNEEITSIDFYDGNLEGDLISRKFLQTAIHNFFNGLNHAPTEEDIQRYIEVAPSVENKGEWIPVSERLPEGRTTVLACDRMHDIFVAWFEDNNWTSSDKVFVKGCPILAWQPIPKPYKEGGAK